jgi:anaerobic selenocysteine-containing dehydrogenase
VNQAGIDKGYADGFAFMKAEGAYWNPLTPSKYEAYADVLSLTITDPETILDTDENDYIWKDAEGICWQGTKAEYNDDPSGRTNYGAYKGQEIDGVIYAGFKPDAVSKSGLFEIDSVKLQDGGYPGLPVWMKIPEHQGLVTGELILTSYKQANQSHSRTQNCKYLTEINHFNPAWINSATAETLGIVDGAKITLTPKAGGLYNDSGVTDALKMTTTAPSITVTAKVTDSIHIDAIAISHHLGHWAYGRYATAGLNTNPFSLSDADQIAQIDADPDASLVWWNQALPDADKAGYRPNWIMPNAGDPIASQIRVFDTVVTVAPARKS